MHTNIRDGVLYDCYYSLRNDNPFTELFCAGSWQTMKRIKCLRHYQFQAVLFFPPPGKKNTSEALSQSEKSLLAVIGLNKKQNLRYDRLFICRAGSGRSTRWIEQSLRLHAPQLFIQNRIFEITIPSGKALTPVSFHKALGRATPVMLNQE